MEGSRSQRSADMHDSEFSDRVVGEVIKLLIHKSLSRSPTIILDVCLHKAQNFQSMFNQEILSLVLSGKASSCVNDESLAIIWKTLQLSFIEATIWRPPEAEYQSTDVSFIAATVQNRPYL